MRSFQAVYNEPKRFIGARAPLFDRLKDHNPEEISENPNDYLLDKDQYIASITHEISLMLNTRVTARFHEYESLEDDPLNFGLPSLFGLSDFNSFDAANSAQWWRIAQLCENAISRYEPRLHNTKIIIEEFDGKKQTLKIVVQGEVILNKIRSQVNFPIALDCSTAK